jgi:hypothetical protein
VFWEGFSISRKEILPLKIPKDEILEGHDFEWFQGLEAGTVG